MEDGAKTSTQQLVALGSLLGIISALAYTATNLALRNVTIAADTDWAIWAAALKALPTMITSGTVVAWSVYAKTATLPTARILLYLFLTGMFLQFGGNAAFQWSLSVSGLAITVPVSFAAIIVSGALMGRFFLEEAIGLRTAFSMLILMAAIVVISLGASQATEAMMSNPTLKMAALGILLALLAGFAYGASGVVIRAVVTRDVSLSLTLLILSGCGVVALGGTGAARLGWQRIAQTPTEDWLSMILAGSFNAVAFYSFAASLKYISVNRSNLLNASQTAMCAAFGILLFAEPFTAAVGIGTLLTVVGLVAMGVKDEFQTSANIQPSDSEKIHDLEAGIVELAEST